MKPTANAALPFHAANESQFLQEGTLVYLASEYMQIRKIAAAAQQSNAELKQEVERLIKDAEILSIEKGQAREDHANAVREVERLRADAKRYQFLRSGISVGDFHVEKWITKTRKNNFGGWVVLRDKELDQAIDAALSSQREGKS